jgi:hypothetical protein
MKPFTALLLPLAALVLPAVSWASAAESKWNQERVAALARDLIEPLEALRADIEGRTPAPEKVEARDVVLSDVKRLQSRAGELAQRLASGAGRAETLALFREVESLQNQTKRHAREYPAPFDMHVLIERVETITIQLARYYGKPSNPSDGSQR